MQNSKIKNQNEKQDLKIKRLKEILSTLKKVVIAYSGGLDSAFLVKMAVDSLGRDNVLAVTAHSETYPHSEYLEAKKTARSIGVKHITIHTNELSLKSFKSNPVNRCYYCKKELFKKLDDIRKKYRFGYVLDGTNLDDLKDVRFGKKATQEFGVRSPLLETGITKNAIRKFSKELGLPTWDKPSFACLASRIPFGQRIQKKILTSVDKAESFIKSLGIKQVRVRAHGNTARIEVLKKDLSKTVRFKDAITRRLKQLGFVYVALDLEGYRTGSMHEMVLVNR